MDNNLTRDQMQLLAGLAMGIKRDTMDLNSKFGNDSTANRSMALEGITKNDLMNSINDLRNGGYYTTGARAGAPIPKDGSMVQANVPDLIPMPQSVPMPQNMSIQQEVKQPVVEKAVTKKRRAAKTDEIPPPQNMLFDMVKYLKKISNTLDKMYKEMHTSDVTETTASDKEVISENVWSPDDTK